MSTKQRKTQLEELQEKESSFGRVFKVAGPCNDILYINSGCGWENGRSKDVRISESWLG